MSKTAHTPLNYMQKKFVEEYVLDPSNGTAAAKRAGYSIKSAKWMACELLKDERVKKMIEQSNEIAVKRLGITKERILQELALLAFANLKHIMVQDEEGNTGINLAHLPDDHSSPLTEVTITTSKGKAKIKNIKVKLADKRQALMDMAKIMGYSKEQVEVTGKVSLEQLIEASMHPSTEPVLTEPEPDVTEG